MRKRDPLRKLLNQAAQVGKLDSEGNFTLTESKAIEKLAQFQLPRGSAWILKLVQAAVVADSPELIIRQSAESTALRFGVPEDFELDSLRMAIFSTRAASSRLIEHLRTALWAVGFSDKRPFTILLENRDLKSYLAWDGQEIRQKAQKSKTKSPTLHVVVAFPEQERGRLLGRLAGASKRAAEEYGEIAAFAQACPIPLKFDGRRMDTLNYVYDKVKEADCLDIALLSGTPSQVKSPSFSPPRGLKLKSGWRPTDKFTDGRTFHVSGDPRAGRLGCIARLRYHYKVTCYGLQKNTEFAFRSFDTHSRFCWLSDGVICQTQKIGKRPGPVSALIFLSAEDLQTDISGLRLRPDGELRRRKKEAAQFVAWQLQFMEGVLNAHIPMPFYPSVLISGVFATIFVASAPVSLGKSLMMGAGALTFAGASAMEKKTVIEDCGRALKRLENKLKKV